MRDGPLNQPPLSQGPEGAAPLLRKVGWMAAAGDEALADLALGSRLRRLLAGEVLATQNSRLAALGVVASGRLELGIANADGRRHVTQHLLPGQVFGLIPVIDGQELIHDVIAKVDSSLLLIPRQHFLQALERHAELSHQVLRLMSARSRRLFDALASRHLAALPERAARTLSELFRESGSQPLPLSQTDLADMLGVTRQSVNVVLKAMERAGAIQLQRHQIALRDSKRLGIGPTLAD